MICPPTRAPQSSLATTYPGGRQQEIEQEDRIHHRPAKRVGLFSCGPSVARLMAGSRLARPSSRSEGTRQCCSTIPAAIMASSIPSEETDQLINVGSVEAKRAVTAGASGTINDYLDRICATVSYEAP
jgi:hypothetical protein